MGIYQVRLTESFEKLYFIEANSSSQAQRYVEDGYFRRKDGFVLNFRDFERIEAVVIKEVGSTKDLAQNLNFYSATNI